MGIREPFVSEIAPDTYAINEFGLAAMYLAVGSERALLIDTGCGLTDLPALVRRFTDKPLDVMLTHCHPDHAGGIGWFDRIYLHPDDFPAVPELDADEIRGYNRMLGEQGSFQVYEYDPCTHLSPCQNLPPSRTALCLISAAARSKSSEHRDTRRAPSACWTLKTASCFPATHAM